MRKLAIVGGITVLVLGIAAGAAWGPITRHRAYGAMVAATTPTAATAAAERWYALVADQPEAVSELLSSKAGRPEARIAVATRASRFASLLTIATDEQQPALRTAALQAAGSIFDLARHDTVPLPAGLPAWVAASDSPDELAAAAFSLLSAAKRPESAALALQVAAQPGVGAARQAQALDCAAALLSSDTAAEALRLLAGPAGPVAAAHPAFREAVERCVGTRDLEAVLALMGSADPGVKVLALRCLGQGISLGDGPQAQARRTALAKVLLPRLGKEVPTAELAATMRAARNLQLAEAADAFLEIIPQVDALAADKVDSNWLAEALGRTFVTMRIAQDRAGADATLAKIAAAVADESRRTVAAKALRHVEDTALAHYYPAVEALAAHIGSSQACLESLHAMVGRFASGAEAQRACGENAAKWTALLAKDRPRVTRVTEIRAWLNTHTDKDINRSLGTAKLSEQAAFIDGAKKELMEWQTARSFPLSSGSADVGQLVETLKIFSKLVHEQLVAAGNAGSR